MLPELETQLEDGLSEILVFWIQENQASSIPAITSIPHDVACSAFLQLMSGLKKLKESPDNLKTATAILAKELEFFIGVSTGLRTQGYGFGSIIHCIKTMRFALEHFIKRCITTDNNKFLIMEALHRVTDCIETTILAAQATDDTKETLNEKQTICSSIVQAHTIYKNIFESTSNLVLITDKSGIVIEVNPVAKIFFSGEKIIDSFCGSLLKISGSLDRLLELYPPDTIHEITVSSGDAKRVFNLQIRLLSKSYPLVEGLLLILSDITCAVDHRQLLEQRVVERTRALAKSEKLLKSIFQSIGKGILVLDRELEILQANRMASEMYGVPLEVLIGSRYHLLTDEQGLQAISNTCESLEEGKTHSIECMSIYVDGRRFPSLVTVTSMHFDGQKFWPVIVRDTTEQKELEAGIIEQKKHAEEMNVTLRNVLKSIAKEKREFEENLAVRIRSSLLPTIARIRREKDKDCRAGYLSVLQEQMISLTADFTAAIDGDLLKLSKTELRICQFIKSGMTGKEICDTMNLSFETIQTHRKNIRKKLCLRGKDINLHSFLADKVL